MIQRGLFILVGLGIAGLVVVWSVDWINAPDLFPGDVMEERDCRYCGGTGTDPEFPICHSCSGDGKVNVIIPGPNHPIMISGAVLDYQNYLLTGGPMDMGIAAFQPVDGAIPGATLTLTRLGNALLYEFDEETGERYEVGEEEVRTEILEGESEHTFTIPPSGRFRVQLKPGLWRVTSRANGYQPFDRELNLPALVEPIWQEDTLVIEDPSDPMFQQRSRISLPIPLLRIGQSPDDFEYGADDGYDD
jgi:hypothetical protein